MQVFKRHLGRTEQSNILSIGMSYHHRASSVNPTERKLHTFLGRSCQPNKRYLPIFYGGLQIVLTSRVAFKDQLRCGFQGGSLHFSH